MKDIIVVTGASSGMGMQFVKQISQKETVDEIWVIARRLDRLKQLEKEASAKIVPIAIDLTDCEQISVYNQKLQEEKPNVKILANCAGFGKFDHYENVPMETSLNMVDLNCKAPIAMTDLSLPYMREGARIVNIVSCAAFQPIPYINVYSATKAFMLNYGRALNVELKYRNIRVLSVCPYWTQTEFFDRAIKPENKPVVINYGVLYSADKVIARAIKDMYKNKELSVYGKINNLQWLATKLLPHKLVMQVWLRRQKLDGTREIRK